jgi:hypothetical protein
VRGERKDRRVAGCEKASKNAGAGADQGFLMTLHGARTTICATGFFSSPMRSSKRSEKSLLALESEEQKVDHPEGRVVGAERRVEA